MTGQLIRTNTHDVNGSLTTDGTASYTYNALGRMTSSVVGGITTTYALNGMGQRISKSGPNGTTLYLYDGAGHLLGEYDGSTGTAVQETVWFDDLPVVLMTGTTASAALYNIHADHLRAPKVITDQTGATVWNWTHGPFGKENPTGTLTYNLRFPGQYYDEETGLSYNMNRNYDAQTGRYVESDPIGLEGGINTYGYVGQNPLWAVDPWGLDATRWANSGKRHLFKSSRSARHGPTNGNWGGKCWSGGQYSCSGNPSGAAPPLDSGDEAYQRHYQCYDKCEVSEVCSTSKSDHNSEQCKKACDRILVNKLKSLSANSRQWPNPPRKGTEADSESYRMLAIDYFN